MRRTTLALTQTRIRDYLYFCVTCPKAGGGRARRFFREKSEAQTYLELCRIEQRNYGLAAFSLSESQRIEALECTAQLATANSTLREATKFFLEHQQKVNKSCTVEKAVSELLAARKADGCSARYLGDLRVRLNRFVDDFGAIPLAGISAADIDDWLRALPVGGVTRNSFRRRLSTLFEYGRKRGYAPTNPVGDVERAQEKPEPIGILTVEETQRLLDRAQPEMVPFWAIGAFAGLRTAEIQRLTWSAVNLESGFIEVAAANSKTAARRLVTIQPNLRKWLQSFPGAGGPVCPPGFQRWATADRKAAHLQETWPNNALRHSFASYHLAAFADASKLALEMGNSPRMIFKHYRELVRPAEAAEYWRIVPVGLQTR